MKRATPPSLYLQMSTSMMQIESRIVPPTPALTATTVVGNTTHAHTHKNITHKFSTTQQEIQQRCEKCQIEQ